MSLAAPSTLTSAAEDTAEATGQVMGDCGPSPPECLRSFPPPLKRSEEWFIRLVALMALAYTAFYLFWRWTETLNPDVWVLSLLFVLVESWGFLSLSLLVFTAWKLVHRTALPAPEGLSVDVFITTYNEPLEVVRRTVLAAREIRYPHRTWILDDGRREEFQQLARDIGVGYLTREDNRHAKAGNLNRALKKTDGEFILQLDADHVPLPHILDRLLGFFEDPKVAFVQTPQDFYNFNSFTHRVSRRFRHIYEEQRFFFGLIQPGKDRSNAAFFCGSCGVIRRSALEEIGGFATETITEDMETSLLLHARGWRSIYYAESLAYGLAPGSAEAFHVQRLRWGQGAMQIFRKYNPLTLPGLTLPQRVSYLASMLIYLDGFYFAALYLAPIVFFTTGAFPIQAAPGEFLLHFLPYLALNLLASELLSRGTSSLWMAARYSMAKYFTYIQSVRGLFARHRLAFRVTPKGMMGVSPHTYLPQLLLMVLYALSIYGSLVAREMGWIDYGQGRWGSLAWWLNFVWAVLNFLLAADVVHLTLRHRERRKDYRFPTRLPLTLLFPVEATRAEPGVCLDLNPEGLSFRTLLPLMPGEEISLRLPLPRGALTLSARVLSRLEWRRPGLRLYQYGATFTHLSPQQWEALELFCVHYTVMEQLERYRTHRRLVDLLSQWLLEDPSLRPREMLLPVHLTPEAHLASPEWALLDSWCPGKMEIILPQEVNPGTALEVRLPALQAQEKTYVMESQALRTPAGTHYLLSLRPPPGGRFRPLANEEESFLWIDRVEEWLLPEARRPELPSALPSP